MNETTFTITLSDEHKEKLETLAYDYGISIAELLENLIDKEADSQS